MAPKISRGTIYKRGGTWYMRYCLNGKHIRRTLQTHDEELARRKFEIILGRWQPGVGDVVESPADQPSTVVRNWQEAMEDGLRNSGAWLSVLFQRTQDRSKHRGTYFALTRDELKDIAARSDGRCELTGIRFSWEDHGSVFPPFAPSLDRVIPSHGYSASNCRLICYAANVALSDWGEAVFEKIAQAYVNQNQRNSKCN